MSKTFDINRFKGPAKIEWVDQKPTAEQLEKCICAGYYQLTNGDPRRFKNYTDADNATKN